MSQKVIPDTDHVVRHCPPKKCEATIASPDAFLLRLEIEEEYLSTQWLEKSGEKDLIEQLRAAERSLSKRRSLKRSDRFARLHVGTATQNVSNHCNVALEFRWLGKRKDLYSGVFGIPQDARVNEKIALQLSDSCYCRLFQMNKLLLNFLILLS
jgi:hypothetical protein